jgi:hypothetical protein
MPTTAVSTYTGGFAKRVRYGTLDSAGYLESNDGTAPAAADQTGEEMLQIVGLQDFPFAPADPEVATQTGDQQSLASFIIGPRELPTASITFGAANFAFRALSQGLTDFAVGGGQFIGGQPKNPVYEDLLLLVVSQAKSLESGNLGSMWEGRYIFYCNVAVKGRNGYSDSGLPTYDHTLTANYSTTLPWGVAFADGTHGDTEFVYVDFTWPYEPTLQRWTGDNIETDYNAAENIAEDSAENVIAYVNGTAQTWVTGVPGAGEFGITAATPDVIVFGTAPPASSKIVVQYGLS